MRKVNGRRTPSDGKSSHCLWQAEGDLKAYYGWSVSTARAIPQYYVFVNGTDLRLNCIYMKLFEE